MRSRLCLLLTPLLALACSSKDPEPQTGTGIFVTGCPRAGRAEARLVSDPTQRMTGPDALGGAGDYLLMNDRAAFMITGPGATKTYWQHAGILVDAVGVTGCQQAAPERFSELGVLMGQLKLADFTSSTLRSFSADRAEVINDGKNGKAAVVRVHGHDDYFWLIELTLVKEAFKSGKRRPLSPPLGIESWVDYILEPGSSVLQIELNMKNQGSEYKPMLAGAALFTSDTTPVSTWSGSLLEVGGFSVRSRVPWLLAGAGDGSYAVGIAGGNMGTLTIAGVEAVLDVDQVVQPINLAPAGDERATGTMRYYVAAGVRDGNSATAALRPFQQEGRAYSQLPISGRVLDATGAPLPNIRVDVELGTGSAGKWETLDSMHTDSAGRFAGTLADFLDDGDPPYRLVVRSEEYPLPAPIEFTALTAAPVDITLQPPAELTYTIRDDKAQLIPAKLSLYQNDRLVRHEYVTGMGKLRLPPGTYQIMVTRGFEYDVKDQEVVLPASGASLDVTLAHLVDTTGWLSLDTHVHAGPSADSSVLLPRRIRTAASAGLEVMVGTDHEVVTDWAPYVREEGLGAFVRTIIGEEVTATIPEHTIMFPVPLSDADGVRGRIVPWYGLGVAEIYTAERARGAGVVQLNHPKDGSGCGYMCLIDWDRMAGAPTLTDPTAIGLPAGTSLWSWSLDTIEYMNGNRNVFFRADNPKDTGLFDDWLSFFNHGHRVTGLGVTDTHNDDIGSPLTYFPAGTDKPADLDERVLVAAMKEGRAVVSAGAFARVTVNGTGQIGDTIRDSDGMIDLAVHIEAMPLIDVTHFKVFVNCDEVLNVPTRTPDAVVKDDETVQIPVTRDAHVVVVGFGNKRLPRALDQFDPSGVPRFTTNPIFVDFDGNGVFDAPGGKACAYDLDAP
ncbi:MAG: CehA/McbA family metallohydrolase [Deltaproteobacteria bacterium]|nr:CehA/McbA family metallohydrolase [Deltaproteobacteria bacterium]